MQNKRFLVIGALLGIFLVGAVMILVNGRPVNNLAPEDQPKVVVGLDNEVEDDEPVQGKEDENAEVGLEKPVASPGDTTQPPKTAGYTMAQVATHATVDSCWAAIGSNVYDLTTWIARHPGGKKPIEGLCGIDATARFESKHGGSGAAKAALALLKIGELSQ